MSKRYLNFTTEITPLEQILHPSFLKHKVELWVKRDDLIHATIMGNKWRKLKYNLLEAKLLGYKKILTFGGAFSNHIHAVAAAGLAFGFETRGIIRGDELNEQSNKTLQDAHKWGMKLEFVSRSVFLEVKTNHQSYSNDYFLLPEGGTNLLALKGVKELADEILTQINPTHVCLALGTGGTFVGLCQNAALGKIVAYPVIKGFEIDMNVFPFSEIPNGCEYEISKTAAKLKYGKVDDKLENFMHFFENTYQIPLDPVYTAKLFKAVFEDIEAGFYPENSRIVLVHTGGLQGSRANKILYSE